MPRLRVLLLHEFSGVHTELRDGLRALGVDADLATFGDYHKAFPTDLHLGSVEPGLRNSLGRVAHQLRNIAAYRSYDIIQSISPTPFNKAVSRLVEHAVLGPGKAKYVYLSAGSDTFYRRHVRSLRYWPPHAWYRNPGLERIERRIARRADAIVSGVWDYDYTLRQAGFDPIFIPLPVKVDRIKRVRVAERDPIVVYHPLNRAEGDDFKGTTHIRAAFAALREEFRDRVEFIERGGMTFAEYSRFMESVDVIVDQTNSFGTGMSGLYGLARGQVVLSGNEPATHGLEPHLHSPVINIRPDGQSIAEKLRELLPDRSRMQAIGAAGREFAQRYHGAEVVAKQYLRLYEQLLADGRDQAIHRTRAS